MKRGTSLLMLLLVSVVGFNLANCTRLPSASLTASSGSSASSSPAVPSEFVILPGDRIGTVTATTTFQDLINQFGADQLTNQPYNLGEGELVSSTRVDLGEARSFTILWEDENQTQVTAVTELGPAWKTPEGIGMGTSLKELEAKLGEFQLYGFGWDYSGTVMLQDTNLAQYEDVLILRLSPDPVVIESQLQAYQSVLGDAAFPSSNAAMQTLNPTVDRMIVRLAPAPTTAAP